MSEPDPKTALELEANHRPDDFREGAEWAFAYAIRREREEATACFAQSDHLKDLGGENAQITAREYRAVGDALEDLADSLEGALKHV